LPIRCGELLLRRRNAGRLFERVKRASSAVVKGEAQEGEDDGASEQQDDAG
jgi:hypothetical protein